MKNIFTLILLALATFCAAQTNQVKTPGVSYSAGAPNWVPVVKTASELAIDTVAKRMYLWNRNTGAWDLQGQGIDNTSGGTPPAYTPGQTDSKFALNNANPPELYAWTGSAWAKVGGTVQTIDTFSVSGSIVSLSLSNDAQPAKTITLPASGITALTGDVTATGPGSVAATIANGAVSSAKLASMGASAGQVLGYSGSAWGPVAAGWGLSGNAATAGSSFLGTTNNVGLRFRTNNTQRMHVDSLGNIGIGVNAPLSRLHVTGSDLLGSTSGFLVSNSGGSKLFDIRNSGLIRFGNLPNGAFLYSSDMTSGGGTPNMNGLSLEYGISSPNPPGAGFNYAGNFTHTTGTTFTFFRNSAIFQPTSGSVAFNYFAIENCFINQTGGANGIVRGFYFNPTITSAPNLRAIETIVGDSRFCSTSGSVGIGVATGTSLAARLHVVGAGNTSATTTAVFHNSTGTNHGLAVQDDGVVRMGLANASGYDGYLFVSSRNNRSAIIGNIEIHAGTSPTWVGQGFGSPGSNRTFYISSGNGSNASDAENIRLSYGEVSRTTTGAFSGVTLYGRLNVAGVTSHTVLNMIPQTLAPATGVTTWTGIDYNPTFNAPVTNHYAATFRSGFVGIGTATPTDQLDINGASGHSQLRLRTAYTPTGTSDTNGNTGDISWDENYWYVKTAAGWKRSALTTW